MMVATSTTSDENWRPCHSETSGQSRAWLLQAREIPRRLRLVSESFMLVATSTTKHENWLVRHGSTSSP